MGTLIKVDNAQTWAKTKKREHANGSAEFIKDGNLEVWFSKWQRKFSKVDKTHVGNYHIFETDKQHAEYLYVFSCTETCAFGYCSHNPMLWVMTRSPDNYFNGKTVEDRVQEAVQHYVKAGASSYAAAKIIKEINYNKFDFCDEEL